MRFAPHVLLCRDIPLFVDRNIRIAILLGMMALASTALADLLPVANGSFESPATTFVTTTVTGWTFAGPPETGVAGIFTNNSTAPDSPAHIQNPDGTQLAFIGTQTGNELTQILPANAFEAGKQYVLSVGIATSYTVTPLPTDAVRIALYYSSAGQRQIVASTHVFNDAQSNLSSNLVKYFTARSPIFRAGDPAIGQPIGIELTTLGASGHYYDLENVTLESQLAVSASEQLVVDFPEAAASLSVVPEPAALSGGLMVLALACGRKT